MLRGIYTAASGMIHTQKKQDATANNIANAGTAGYKQDRVAAKPFAEVMLQNRDNTESGFPEIQKIGKMVFGVENGEAYTDFSQGTINETGNSMDMAISGKGLFTVKFFDGIKDTIKYTRDGSFRIDNEGKIVTSNGGYPIGKNIETGETGPMFVGGGNVAIDGNGVISVDGVSKYNVIISDFDNYDGVKKEGSNMYSTLSDSVQPFQLNSGQYEIRQSCLEQSNTDISSEMVSMITNLRSFQANQRVIQSIDETLGKAVNEVGALR